MGLKFCNEAVMFIAQLYPPYERMLQMPLTPLQVMTASYRAYKFKIYHPGRTRFFMSNFIRRRVRLYREFAKIINDTYFSRVESPFSKCWI